MDAYRRRYEQIAAFALLYADDYGRFSLRLSDSAVTKYITAP